MLFPRIKSILWDECLPLLFFVLFNLMWSLVIFIWPVMLYLCFKWKGWIFVCIGYYLWVRYDSVSMQTGGRKVNWLKHSKIFDCIRDYFPIRLIKTTELVPGNNYIFACFPHGVMAWGLIFNFFSNNLAALYPGFHFRGIMFNIVFSIPILREYFMAMGCCSADENNIKYLLNNNVSSVLVFCPGGLEEIAHSHPGSKSTILKKKRKGFVRIALQTGSALVPVFSFGENNTLEGGSFDFGPCRYFYDIFYKLSRVRLFTSKGRYFNFGFNIIPHRRPVTTVVGAAIEVPKVEHPSDALIDEYHEKFYQALSELFEKHKGMYDEAGENAKLEMI